MPDHKTLPKPGNKLLSNPRNNKATQVIYSSTKTHKLALNKVLTIAGIAC